MLSRSLGRRCSLVVLAVLPWGCGGSGSGDGEAAGGTGPVAGSSGSAGNPAAGSAAGGGSGAGAPSSAGAGSGGLASSDGGAAGLGGTGGAAPSVDLSAELYDPERVPRFDLELPQASMQALGAAPDVYVKGTLRYGDEVVADIGVRIKGEASQRSLAEKAAFKLKFDEFVPKQSFRGLRRLTFNNMVEDPSYLAERLAFHFFRELKLPAPRCNHAQVYVNGTLFGLYANIETEDKVFLRRWFESDAGNLYEEGQVDFETGNEAKFDLETNEQANDRSDLTALIAALAAAKSETFVADLGKQLDMPHFLAFTAAEAAVNQWDMYGYTVFYPNNFRIYRNPTSQRFVMLPWGMDMSMKPYRDSGKPHIMPLELARQYDQDGGKVTAGKMFQGCLASPGCRAQYIDVVEQTAQRYQAAQLEPLARKFHAQIAAHIDDDPRREYTTQQIEQGYASLLKTIRERPQALLDALEP